MIKSKLPSVVDLTSQLIACPSVTPQDAGCQKIISQRLAAIGFQCEPMQFSDVNNLWARYGTRSPLIVFAGHTDVVPPGPTSDWSSPPFQPDIRDNTLYGRGAVDMKSAIAAMVTAVETFVKTNPIFPGSIGFLLTSDEEGSAINGTVKVMETLLQRGEKIDYCLVGEPSSNKKVGDQIRIGRRGSLHAKITIHGKQGHVAHPHLAMNPIHTSANALHELAGIEWDKGNEYYPPTTFQISNIHSGTGAANVIPGHLDLLCNFRFSTAVTVNELKERTEAILKKHGLQYNVEWHISAEPFLTKKGKFISLVQQAIQDITGLSAVLSTGGGTSDGRFIAPTGTEVIELGVSNATAHHVNECVDLDELITLERIYNTLLHHIFD
ncbi:MAG: succinyl-diaminopimelate desuccinylase [Gammaproteobacteria bacterium]|nr:succinyl-diaminopimelate desuccinylase [Gammaproteobacteria bacterium]MCW5582824.1 succinyl-diaminopimelate desuccinylase [Gammaproteobacteria bacterium]